jgi:hypothetical protein
MVAVGVIERSPGVRDLSLAVVQLAEDLLEWVRQQLASLERRLNGSPSSSPFDFDWTSARLEAIRRAEADAPIWTRSTNSV